MKSSVDQLNSFLRGEIAAVETYRMALAKIEEMDATHDQLITNLHSHEDRVGILEEAIRAIGGEPATSSGPWGVFVRSIEGGAQLFGRRATLAVLEEGEDHGLVDYREDLDDDELDAGTKRVVRDTLLPAQQLTHDSLSGLRKRL
ncbi:MAG: DUF2383 domain-containing protein [Deltaproteobacteria bacterium]|nr:DUF2383 domain-containing protein [Deltaproteobacteria bacterium]